MSSSLDPTAFPSPPAWPEPSPAVPGPAGPTSLPTLLWGRDGLAAAARPGTAWLWQGYLAPGAVTLLTSQWKSGKTTLASVLLARLKAGGPLAGLPVAPATAVVVSEEGPEHWLRRARTLDFGDHVGWFCRPFRGKPTAAEWLALLDGLAAVRRQRGLDLVVIDPLAAFLPGRTENDAACVLDALAPLQRLTAQGVAVLVLHHPRKGKSPAGHAARGSGALSGFADILIEMRWHGRAAADNRRRRLRALSRYDETPRDLVIELNAEGTDYQAYGSAADEDFAAHWEALQAVLAQAAHKLTRPEIRRQWPAEAVPADKTLYRWLQAAVGRGLVRQGGRGLRGQPFRYWLPARDAGFTDDLSVLLEQLERAYPPRPGREDDLPDLP
jgi:hypothetical protein